MFEADGRHIVTILLLLCASASHFVANGQNNNPLQDVRRVYLNGFGNKAGADDLKKALTLELRKAKAIAVVDSAAQADAILSGEGEIYAKSYFSLNPRAGVSPNHGEPLYSGSLSVELKDRNGETLWSYLATPRWGVRNAARELSRDVVKHLVSGFPNGAKR